MKDANLLPWPRQVEQSEGVLRLTSRSRIRLKEGPAWLRQEATLLSDRLFRATGARWRVTSRAERRQTTDIVLEAVESDRIPSPEGYQLEIRPAEARLLASAPAGVFYGGETLLQLLPLRPPRVAAWDGASWLLPVGRIEDKPRFSWRGMHLDVGRHFMPVTFIKRFIDLLAMHKMNVFHWHLTEDQGWRIELRGFPKLTTIGAWRAETGVGHARDAEKKYDGIPHGGFYSREDILDVVRYAAQRHVRVVPAIEMPGHARAALAAYPELSCSGGPFEVACDWGIFKDVFCAGNDRVLDFIERVLDEVLDLFPSPYIHIGGDECPKDRWKECPRCQARIRAEGLKDEQELQSWFIRRVSAYLEKHGRRLIGWDEILEGGLAPGATVMVWRHEASGIEAAKAGHDVIMAPKSHVYFDYYQADPAGEPLAIGGLTPLEKVYAYEPVPADLPPAAAPHILGAQGQLWTEYMADERQVEYMAFPRLCALAEVVWSPRTARQWEVFRRRLAVHLLRLNRHGVHYRHLDAD